MRITKNQLRYLIRENLESSMDYSKDRGIRVTPIGLQAESERKAVLQGFSDNGKYTIIEGPYWLSKDYIAAIIDYHGSIFGVYTTSGYSSLTSDGMTSIGWVITGGMNPDGSRIYKLPNHRTQAFGDVSGKYPIQYKVYKEVLEDLSAKLDKNTVKNSILQHYGMGNIYEYLRKLGYTGSGQNIMRPFEEDRINFFNNQLHQLGAYRPNETIESWLNDLRVLSYGEDEL
jgi:hypothetical protein